MEVKDIWEEQINLTLLCDDEANKLQVFWHIFGAYVSTYYPQQSN